MSETMIEGQEPIGDENAEVSHPESRKYGEHTYYIAELKKLKPDQRIDVTAVQELKSADEIRTFFTQYYELNLDKPENKGESTQQIHWDTLVELGHLLGYYDDATKKLWFDALAHEFKTAKQYKPMFGQRG